MKKLLLVGCVLLISKVCLSQSVNFPDPALSSVLLNQCFCADTDGNGLLDSFVDMNFDGIIQQSEADQINGLFLNNAGNVTDLSGLDSFSNLNSLEIRNTTTLSSVDGVTFTVLEKFICVECDSFNLNNLDSFPVIEDLIVKGNNSITSLDLTNANPNFEVLEVGNTENLTSIALNPSLKKLRIPVYTLNQISSHNYNGILDLSNLNSLEELLVPSYMINSNEVNNLINLDHLYIYSPDFQTSTISSIDVSNAPNLTRLSLLGLQNLSSLALNSNQQLYGIRIHDSQLSQVNIPNMSSLRELSLENNPQLQPIDLTLCQNIEHLSLQGIPLWNIIDTSAMDELLSLHVYNMNIQNLDLTANPLIQQLFLVDLPLNNIDLDNQNELFNVMINSMPGLIELDLSNKRFLNQVRIESNPVLQYINLKSPFSNWTVATPDDFSGNSSLNSICVKESYISGMNSIIQAAGYPDNTIQISSYCSFEYDGLYEINGKVQIDLNQDGCNVIDSNYPFLKFNIEYLGNNLGYYNANLIGEFSIPLNRSSNTSITPQPENPSYWNFSPASVTVDFPSQSSPFTQDFCVTPNGTIEDLEVIVTPLEQARPGFETDYKVVVKNKGNQNASGTVTLDYDADYMMLFDSAPAAGTANAGQLDWSFTDIAPFQMEEYNFIMTLNTPTDPSFPLNGDDELSFTGIVTGMGTDNMPADNTMTLEQIVVNSYDPNDKRCLEGEKIEPSMVGEYVHYMIRFENTGTASAINVVVKDAIDPMMFDVSTFVPLGGSHDYYVRTVEDGNTFEFIHENINLDFNDATNDGYVLFKVKTLPTLSEGDTFNNDAEIYFDFNAPIVTNDFVTTVQSTASVSSITDDSIRISPNPTSGILHLNAQSAIKSLTIHDLNGRLLNKTSFVSGALSETVNFENLNSGIYLMTVETSVGQVTERVVVK